MVTSGLFGRGLIGPDSGAPQKRGKRDWDFEDLGLCSVRGDVDVDLSYRIPDVLCQGMSNTCVANAWEQALRLTRILEGQPSWLGSRLFGYSQARAQHGGQKADLGTYLRSYAHGLKKNGNVPETSWAFDLSRVNQTPPASIVSEAWGYRGIKGYYKIFSRNDQRTHAIRAALLASKPVVAGWQIDNVFMDSFGPDVVEKPDSDDIVGAHAMCYVGFKWSRSLNCWIYKIVNSWGDSWRSNGYVWITEEYAQWSGVQDHWVVSLH